MFLLFLFSFFQQKTSTRVLFSPLALSSPPFSLSLLKIHRNKTASNLMARQDIAELGLDDEEAEQEEEATRTKGEEEKEEQGGKAPTAAAAAAAEREGRKKEKAQPGSSGQQPRTKAGFVAGLRPISKK